MERNDGRDQGETFYAVQLKVSQELAGRVDGAYGCVVLWKISWEVYGITDCVRQIPRDARKNSKQRSETWVCPSGTRLFLGWVC